MTDTATVENTVSSVDYRYCPICAGQMYWVEAMTLVPELPGFECEDCFYFELT